MRSEYLIHMANQIAAFFAPYTEDEAVVGIAGHLEKFWEPRMRERLQALAAGGAEGIAPLVLRALAEPNLAGK